MRFGEVVKILEGKLAGALPGAAAHALVAPVPRRNWPAGFNPARIRNAAGLVLLFPVDDRPHVVLTVRSESLGRHSGQVSLPGGAVDPGETFEQAALREAREEVSLDSRSVRVLGALTPLDIPVSGFRLHPIVGTMDVRPSLVATDGEVARVLSVALDELLDPRAIRWTERSRDGVALTVPAFAVHGEELWGATAMVMAELLVVLGWAGPATSA
jgi:8-oxo-dGTP pyrophosphatase MutT (NUDIX family)